MLRQVLPSAHAAATRGESIRRLRAWTWLATCLACVACDGSSNDTRPASSAAEFRATSVEEALDAAERAIRTRGFETEAHAWRGFLVRQSAQVSPMNLQASACYVLLGANSRALSDLDLRIFDSDGSELAQDVIAGAGAAIHFCPPQSGTYYIAARASKGSGLFSVRRYVGPTGLDVKLDDLFVDHGRAASSEAAP